MTAEPLARTAPLAVWGDALAALPDGVQITPWPFVAMAGLRVDPQQGIVCGRRSALGTNG